MRFGKFESAGLKPLSKSETKEVFKNPTKEGQIVSVLKEKDPGYYMKLEENEEKKNPRTLKGAFYLTKIAHVLRPQEVPNIHQIGETVDGQQTVDRDLKELVRMKRGEAAVADIGLKEIGLGYAIDTKVNNYTKDAEGTVSYLDEFTPWEINSEARTLELNFDAEQMTKAIEELPDETQKKECEDYFDRLMTLYEEERAAFAALENERLVSQESMSKQLEALLVLYEAKHDLEFLHSLQTEEEARNNPQRKAAMDDLPDIYRLLTALSPTYIGMEKKDELQAKYKRIAQATGLVNGGRIDHTR